MSALYALRFFGSIGIFMHHIGYPYGLGSILVTFFFILSGFTTAYSFKKENFVLNKSTLKKYYIKKVSKLYPLHIFTFLLSIPMMGYMQQKISFVQGIINICLLQSYYPNQKEVFLFNGLSWFMADILFFYIVIPFVYRLITKLRIERNLATLIFSGLVIYCISFIISYQFKGNMEAYTFGWWYIYISPYFRVLDCLIGFLAGLAFVKIKERLTDKLNNSKLIVFTFMEILSLLFSYLAYKSKLFQIDSVRCGVYYIPVLTLIIFVFALGKGFISKGMSIKVLVHLGEKSNVIYMLHQMVIFYTTYLFGSTIYYSDKMTLNTYFAQFYLLIIVLCISDVVNKIIDMVPGLIKNRSNNLKMMSKI